MTPKTLDEQLTKYLTDAHSIEVQALEQMKRAPEIAGDPEISRDFTEHLEETREHERRVRTRLEARDAGPSALKDLAGRATGIGFALFAKFQPDTPGKLVAHAFSYEHMELATYDLLARVAERAGDEETARVASEIEAQEQAMAQRLERTFDRAAEASLRELSPDDLSKQLDRYLEDAHAIEAQATELLSKGPKLAGAPELAEAYEEHLRETREHERLISERLVARGKRPSMLKDTALRLGALNWGAFFGAQPDTPAKLAGFAYAFEHLEIASYELLTRVARRAGDGATEAVAQQILAQERAAAGRLRSLFGRALEASLDAQGVAGAPR
jgi:ferritin-like metal-binding protein YciE